MKNKRRKINSLLDLDFYKLTMGQFAFEYFMDIPVVYGFTNRTKTIKLTKVIKEADLRREIEHISNLRFTEDEIEYLRNVRVDARGAKLRLFKPRFLDFLKNLKLGGVTIVNNGESYQIEIRGAWPEVILWETLILSTVNELYYDAVLKENFRVARRGIAEGKRRLAEKIKTLKANPDIRFSDFGTRRRFAGWWQEYVVRELLREVPNQITGTSNVCLAKKLGIQPIGTMAHEVFMVFSGIFHEDDDDIRESHNKVLKYWLGYGGRALSIALTDTYGTDFFFRDMTKAQAGFWNGLRQDSGDPIEFGEKAIAFYENYRIDPKEKVLVFSDGLDVDTIVKIADHFRGRINVTFGWGTNLSNDLGFETLSLVVKAIESCGHGTVKLSDNLAKAIGKPEDVERFKRIFGHDVEFSEECRY